MLLTCLRVSTCLHVSVYCVGPENTKHNTPCGCAGTSGVPSTRLPGHGRQWSKTGRPNKNGMGGNPSWPVVTLQLSH